MKSLLLTCQLLLVGGAAFGQGHQPKTYPLADLRGLKPLHVRVQPVVYQGKKAVLVADTARGITSERKYAKLTDASFHNGSIEVELAGRPSAQAGPTARGFVGLAFRIDAQDARFECFYLRPTNGRADDQVRRNHSAQYVSYPDYPWERLRKETPEKYESYVDLEVGRWTKVRIVVQDDTARLYVHGAAQPTLVVLDLKHGAAQRGGLGLWVGSGTEAYFRNLVVTPAD